MLKKSINKQKINPIFNKMKLIIKKLKKKREKKSLKKKKF